MNLRRLKPLCVILSRVFVLRSLQVMGYLRATPDRMCAAEVCQPWAEGARHKTFKLRVRQARWKFMV